MAFLQVQEIDWHKGELAMQNAMHVPHNDNPTVPTLSPQLANHLQIAPLISIGVLINERPWTTLWGGEQLGAPVAKGIIGLRAPVTPKHDPVVEELFGLDGKVIREEGKGRMISGVTIDLETRKRVKLFGRMVAGGLSNAEAQLVIRIEQSLGNCPKYLNKKHIVSAEADPKLVSSSPRLPQQAVDLLSKSDLFFISSTYEEDMDTNHRGGPAGFMRTYSNDESGAILCWPEYSGNRLYQTLGNLKVNPLAGICVPDFDTGDMLYMTGSTEILVGSAAASFLPKTNLAVKFTVMESRYVEKALPFRGISGESSPYNPTVRLLTSEKKQIFATDKKSVATLIDQTKLTPTISRYKFSLDEPASYKSGQYVTFDFSSLLDIGWSHMRNDDPRSLNDDFIRTFTVSSSPDHGISSLKDNEFEITIRHVGVVTEYMSKHLGTDHGARQGLEVDIRGFGGDFEVDKQHDECICFIAAGVGITPLLPALSSLDLQKLQLFWSMRTSDLGLVQDVLVRHPQLASQLFLFVSDGEGQLLNDLKSKGVRVRTRRIAVRDVQEGCTAEKVYLCTGTAMRKQLIEWLPDKQLMFEDFNF